ncbi:MAG: TonB-dependent receptor plug domain-containing protein, partial [Bacteroidales bacterium]|nr:TonB-dependent receptor plug domain-containing protein [Candidatus Liminaster caballi]
PIRYNILTNQLAVITPDGKLPVIPHQDKINWFELDGIKYVRENGWLMREEYHGENITLLLNKTKQYAGEVEIDRHIYRRIVTVDRYYLRLKDGSLHEVKGIRSLRKAVPEYRNELRQFSRSHDLGFWRTARFESLKKCTEHLNWLMNNEAAHVQVNDTVYTLSATMSSGIIATDASDELQHVPAYLAYSADSNARLEYDDEEIADTGIAGITPINNMQEPKSLKEVEVLGMKSKLSQQFSGVESFRPALLRNIPMVMGESDVLKIALKMPGVASTGEVASGLNVRGGATEHTLMLYNNNTIFNPMHMFGLFSAFDSDLIGETELYKGGIPSQYGGRLSSVMDIKGKMPDRKEFHGSASIGMVTSRAATEIPIIKDRMSLLLGGRATYSDWMLKLIPKIKAKKDRELVDGGTNIGNTDSYRNGKAGYWDMGGTLSTILSHEHTLRVNGYYSHDRFSLTADKKYAYSNMNFSAELLSHYEDQLSTSLSAGYDHYGYTNLDTEYPTSASSLSFGLNQYFAKYNATYNLCEEHTINCGIHGQYYNIMPGSHQPYGEYSYIIGRKLDTDQAIESALWIEDTWSLWPDMSVTGGLRLNLFKSFKKNLATFNVRPDIRLSANYMLNDNSSVKAGFNTLHQYIHKVSNTVIMSPTDTWMLSNSAIKPQSGWQASAGYYLQFANGIYEFSAETYFKGMNNYLTYRGAAILVMNENLHKDVIGTKGRAYGIELQIRKLYGRLNGWLNYTYSRTELRQEGNGGQQPINGGRWFAADYDCPHNLKLVCNYKFTRRYSTSLNADYSTGRPFTAPIGIMPSESTGQYSVPIYSERNKLRMPDYFRMDWSFNIEPSHHLTALTHSWLTIGIYNVLGRRNAYSIYFEGNKYNIKGYKLSIFGAPIPYINYNIKF